ncbi:hypothetical protein ABT126_39070 [Streptomyces sp. NPDC002012]|uniref:hypothetical protein n=1 Tax=Streptomyces sp. NPDC002012 TaxID=3154532 RepID=UPI0033175368
MSPVVQRFVGAVGAVVVAAVVNVATGFLTDHRSTRWWVSAAVLLVVGVAVQWWLPAAPAQRRSQSAEDNTVGGSFTQKSTGPAEQEARRNDITGDFDQRQDG